MIRNLILRSIRGGVIVASIILVAAMTGCSSDDGGTSTTAGGTGGGGDGPAGGPAGGTGGDATGGVEAPVATEYNAPTRQCDIVEPPMADPYCFNDVCPNASLPGLTDVNKTMGDCCNSVDIKRLEASMAPGTKYDLEFVNYIQLPQSMPNLTNPVVQGLLQTGQENGADVTLIRFHDVPRTEDMTEPVLVDVEMGVGKMNCDGSYSFYGPNAAPAPIHDGPPNDPGRWQVTKLQFEYNGFNATELATHPAEEIIAQNTQLHWVPRWTETGIDYEQPLEFMSLIMTVDPNNWSCFGSIDSGGAWTKERQLTAFLPVEQLKKVPLPALGGQTQCGLLARGAGAGECDVPQSEWETKPQGYCNEQYLCWVGVADDPEAASFWEEFYEGEDNCGSAEHPCCDPAGVSTTLPACNAYYNRSAIVLAATNITDSLVDSPEEAHSHKAACK